MGLFTVIKKAWWDGNQRLAFSLRLVFDERFPNELWRSPPWIGLAGPGCLSALDTSEYLDEDPRARLHFVGGDLNDYYY